MYQTPEERREHSRQEDRELIARAIGGDQEAFKRLMAKYQGAIHHLVVRMIGPGEDADDLTQEAFIKAFNALASFNDEFAFSTWLYKIASNNCIDHLRRKRLRTFSIDRPVPGDDGEHQYEIPDVTYAADADILRRQRNSVIEHAIEALPEKYHRVIVMRHQEEKSYEQIAAELDLPLGTVKAHIFRAREILYRALRDRV
jgi:RNA polymerase sigma factor (sigma-70 family)